MNSTLESLTLEKLETDKLFDNAEKHALHWRI
jgi:hypothetical protein